MASMNNGAHLRLSRPSNPHKTHGPEAKITSQVVWQKLYCWANQMPFSAVNRFRLLRQALTQWIARYRQLTAMPLLDQLQLQRRLGTSLAGAALLFVLNAHAAQAAEITVNSTDMTVADDGICTLIEAITAANSDTASGVATGECDAGSGDDTITLAGNSYTLTESNNSTYGPTGLPVISSNITIEGNSATIERVDDFETPEFRLIAVDSSGDLTLNECVISGGQLPSGFINAGYSGAGIYNAGDTTINYCDITGNAFGPGFEYAAASSASASNVMNNYGGLGAGVYNSGLMEINGSSISNNSGEYDGAGIFNYGEMIISNSTIDNNATFGYGGGIANGGPLLTINNSTISGNWALGGGGVANKALFIPSAVSASSANDVAMEEQIVNINSSTITGNNGVEIGGSGIYNSAGTVNLNRSIVSGNLGNNNVEILNGGFGYIGASQVNAGSYNLLGDSSQTENQAFYGFAPGASDIVATSDLDANSAATHTPTAIDDILDTNLELNGGATLTHALKENSPAIDAAGDSGLDADQRNIERPQGQADDIGAFEGLSFRDRMTESLGGFDYQAGNTSNGATLGTLDINFNFDYNNDSGNPMNFIYFRITVANNAFLQNADGGPGRVGDIYSIPNSSLPGNDELFSAGETLTVLFSVGLEGAPWGLNFQMYGSETSGAQGADLYPLGEFVLDSAMVDLNDASQLEPSIFLPLVR